MVRKVLLYGDVNLNIIDGSAIWLVSLAEVLLKNGTNVHLLLKNSVESNSALDFLRENPNFSLHNPSKETTESSHLALSPRVASQRMLALDSELQFDAIIVRGMTVCKFVAMSEKLHSKSWLYVTDLPFPLEKASARSLEDLNLIASRAYRLFSQTEDSRSYLEQVSPASAGKTLLMPPMIPDVYFENYAENRSNQDSNLNLVYAGKFAEDWKTLEMLELNDFELNSGKTVKLTMVGNKFQQSRRDPTWHQVMEDRVSTRGVTWLGGLSRQETMQVIRQADIGLGWRTKALDSSMEISTKALEYAASGVPPLINRTASHEIIFGADYPFFVDDTFESVVEILNAYGAESVRYRDTAREAVRCFSMTAAALRFEDYFRRAIPVVDLISTQMTRKTVLIAGHDFKFAGELIQHLSSSSNVDLLIDKWETLHKHDENKSIELLNKADIVICEWAGPNAVWYSNNVRESQRLFIRLHAFELRGPWLRDININRIDKILCVSELYAEKTVEATNWPKANIEVIPNLVDCADFERSKLPGSQFRIGLVGIVPFIKRPDRALKLLSRLLEQDERYSLHIRGRMPWEYKYEWNKGLQRFAYEEFFNAIAADAKLKNAVSFEEFGPDMASWYRKIGVVLSPSTRESFHLAPIEGMASGAVPFVWTRPGAVEIFSEEFLFESIDDMVPRILALRAVEAREDAVSTAKSRAKQYDLEVGTNKWMNLIFGGTHNV